MNTQNLLKYVKKNYIVSCSVGLALVCGATYFIRSGSMQHMRNEYSDYELQRATIMRDLRDGDTLEADLVRLKEKLGEAEARLFSPEDLASNKYYFYQLESSTGVDLPELQQIARADDSGGKGSKKKKGKKTEYQEIVYELKVVGEYANILKFLRELEGGKSFYRLKGMSLVNVRGYEDGDQLEMSLGLAILGKKS